MADMEIKVNRNPIQVNNNTIKTPAQTQAQGIEKTAPQKPEVETKAREQRIEEALENVVSVSKDGDTVQVTDESNERLEEDAFGKMAVRSENNNIAQDDDATEKPAVQNGRTEINTEAVNVTDNNKAQEKPAEENAVSPTRERLKENADTTKPDPAKERLQAQRESDERRKEIIKDMVKSADDEERADDRAEAKEEQQMQNITSFTGYTDQQLQQMVRDGQITQNDYDREMEARSEKTQAAIDNNNEFARDMAVNIAEEELTQRQADELRTGYDEDSADVPDAETRADILDKLQDFTLNA